MGAMEEKFQQKCAARDIPGVVLVASDATGMHLLLHLNHSLTIFVGKFVYQNAIGMKTPTTPMNLDTTFIMASCTKLMTSIAAMQCVERGQITLDEAVSHVLPELKNLDILTGFTEAGEPMYKKSTRAITLRSVKMITDSRHKVLTTPKATLNPQLRLDL
jgi:CubicO group peptidase (beta-lactamase class C family)